MGLAMPLTPTVSSMSFAEAFDWRSRRPMLSLATFDDEEEPDEGVELFEFDGGLDVSELLAALDDGADGIEIEGLGALVDDSTETMRPTPMLIKDDEWDFPPSALPITSVVEAERVVRMNGVARVPAMSSVQASALRADILEQLEQARQENTIEAHGTPHATFSSVLAPSNDNGEVRWDLRLALTPAVKTALRTMFVDTGDASASLGTLFEALAGGGEAEVWELAALISAPGAPSQPVHSDTLFSTAPCLFTAFVALQEIAHESGPTRFVPGSHVATAHAFQTADAERAAVAAAPSCVALLEPGEAALYDGRLRHSGRANTGDVLRVLFYVTLRHPDATDTTLANEAAHSIRHEYAGRLRLRDLRRSATSDVDWPLTP